MATGTGGDDRPRRRKPTSRDVEGPEILSAEDYRIKVAPLFAFTSESEFNQTVRRLLEAHGWRVFVTHNSKHSPAGEFDVRAFRPPRVLIAELKLHGNKPSPEQWATYEFVRPCPHTEVYLWYPIDYLTGTIERLIHRDRIARPEPPY